MGTIRIWLAGFCVIFLCAFGCNSRAKETALRQKSVDADTSAVPGLLEEELNGLADLNDTISIDEFRDGKSILALELVYTIQRKTKYMFVLQPTRLDYVRVTISKGRLPLKELLHQLEIGTKSTITVSDRNLILAPND